jgi:septum formation protein
VRFVLASASPARLATLRAAGVLPEVVVSRIDESEVTAESTGVLVQELADRKAAAVDRQLGGEVLVLGCDSLLEFEGQALGKPRSSDEAVARWQRMRGRRGVLYTGHCLIDHAAARAVRATAATTVYFADLTDEEVETYCRSGEPKNVAGAFTIDGFGGWFIERIEGDHHNVVGLSLPVLRGMLRELNFSLPDIGYPAS